MQLPKCRYGVLHAEGWSEDDPPLEGLPALYDELEQATPEHGDVSVINDDLGWTISAHRDRRVLLIKGNETQPQHMLGVGKGATLRLWRALISGNLSEVNSQPWQPGRGPSATPPDQGAQ